MAATFAQSQSSLLLSYHARSIRGMLPHKLARFGALDAAGRSNQLIRLKGSSDQRAREVKRRLAMDWGGDQLGHDLVMSLVTLSGALGSLKFFDELAKRDVFDKKLSRKLVHICVGLVFMLFWPLFSNAPRSRYLAAIAPFTNAVRMVALGSGLWENKALVKAVSRGGEARELLKGPLYYAITITIATVFFWRNSPIGAATIANLCAGDGFADIIGRRYGGGIKLPYNPTKSLAGSIAMFVAGSAFSIAYVWLFCWLGYTQMSAKTVVAMVGISLGSTIVESLPLSSRLDDNLTVPCTSITLGLLFLT